MTEGGDIRFRVYTNNAKGNTEDLVLPCRVDSHLAIEEGQITCEEPGKCMNKSALSYYIVSHPHNNNALYLLLYNAHRCLRIRQHLQLFANEESSIPNLCGTTFGES